MHELHADDADLDGLLRAVVSSSADPNISYSILRRIGSGAMAVVMLAERRSATGTSPIVLKILTPSFVLEAGNAADLVFQKEATALAQLSQRVPRTPNVVHLLDHGALPIRFQDRPLSLSWLALELVHGGSEGTTLDQRVTRSIERTGAAFDPLRAADAIRSIGLGLSAVHSVGVIHRDMKLAGSESVLRRLPDPNAKVEVLCRNEGSAPCRVMFAQSGLLLAVTADGGVLEGHVRGALG